MAVSALFHCWLDQIGELHHLRDCWHFALIATLNYDATSLDAVQHSMACLPVMSVCCCFLDSPRSCFSVVSGALLEVSLNEDQTHNSCREAISLSEDFA
jgi:hypothetical protein